MQAASYRLNNVKFIGFLLLEDKAEEHLSKSDCTLLKMEIIKFKTDIKFNVWRLWVFKM